ncbi:MAG: phage protease, partial [Rubrivivax sp.]|nr:phage protease [Rubrivivax sp.]
MRLLTALLAATFALAADGWVQLLPTGEFAARDGRPGPGKKWSVDDTKGQALAAQLNAAASKSAVVIDYDHQTLYLQQHGQKVPAAGWIEGNAAEWRPGSGLWAKVKWTAAAAEHIERGEYRYVSPLLLYDENTLEVSAVAMAALVNYPALLGMHPAQAALANQFQQEQPTMNPILAALLAGLGLAETATQAEATAALSALQLRADKPAAIPAALATALKLPATANEAAALAAVTALTNTDTAGLQAMAALQGQVAELTARLNEDTVTKTVDAAIAACKLTPAQRDWALGLGKKDMAA